MLAVESFPGLFLHFYRPARVFADKIKREPPQLRQIAPPGQDSLSIAQRYQFLISKLYEFCYKMVRKIWGKGAIAGRTRPLPLLEFGEIGAALKLWYNAFEFFCEILLEHSCCS